MPKVIDVSRVQDALDRAARNARRGSSDVRAGKFLVGRDAATGRFAERRDNAPTKQGKVKK
jgi:Flp pilus assembly protein TadG